MFRTCQSKDTTMLHNFENNGDRKRLLSRFLGDEFSDLQVVRTGRLRKNAANTLKTLLWLLCNEEELATHPHWTKETAQRRQAVSAMYRKLSRRFSRRSVVLLAPEIAEASGVAYAAVVSEPGLAAYAADSVQDTFLQIQTNLEDSTKRIDSVCGLYITAARRRANRLRERDRRWRGLESVPGGAEQLSDGMGQSQTEEFDEERFLAFLNSVAQHPHVPLAKVYRALKEHDARLGRTAKALGLPMKAVRAAHEVICELRAAFARGEAVTT
jgi:DNA-directed RNA polymerase specialized sigma24 family protein